MIGKSFLHYRILDKLGQGGMGEVYRAEDTKLKREIALKVLPPEFTQDQERLARFEREAQLLASLNHPHIAGIHGLEEAEGIRFLVLELVEGETLAERIAKGPLPVEEAIEVSRQIAEGLEAAHEKSIIHRDLKPANVKITPEGKVKVMDFGLAKAFEEEPAAADVSYSPTLTAAMTRVGVILGTAAYMAPEQARGQTVDKRADIWAFGVVLYEMLTGRRLFDGETLSDTLAAVLRAEVDWSALPEATPPWLRRLLERCLERDRKMRLHDIADARIEIEKAPEKQDARAAPAPTRRLPWAVAAALALLAGIALIGLWNSWNDPMPESGNVTRFAFHLAGAERIREVERVERSSLTLSRDGRRLVYAASRGGTQQLYLQEMDQYEARPIPGTEDARNPFFSPNGEWVAFLTTGKLKKVSLSTGEVSTLCDALPVSSGGSWGEDDSILFTPTPNGGLAKVSDSGGSPLPVTSPDNTKGQYGHRYPSELPGGKAVLFTVTGKSFGDTGVGVLSLETGEWRTLVKDGTCPVYLSTGHLLYARAGELFVVPFDLERLRLTGSPVRVLAGIATRAGAEFSLSENGTLVYLPGTGGWPGRTLVWVDRQGQTASLPFPPRHYRNPRLSGDRAVVAIHDQQTGDSQIWVFELERPPLTRFTLGDESCWYPAWTPDAKQVAYSSGTGGGPPDLTLKSGDGTDAEKKLAIMENAQFPTSWSHDGNTLLFTNEHPETKYDIWILPMGDEGKAEPWLKTQSVETAAVFSPGDRWIAYQSDETGRFEIYVKPFHGQGRAQPVSTEGGSEPVWSPDGRELFYREGDKMMVVAVETDAEFSAAIPRILFEGQYAHGSTTADYDISPDAKRFLMIKLGEQEGGFDQIRVVLNWFEELKRELGVGPR